MRQIWILLVRIVLSVLVVYLLWRVGGILKDVLISAILAFALVGPVNRLCAVQIPHISPHPKRLIMTLIVFLAMAFVVVKAVTIMVAPFREEVRTLTTNKAAVLSAANSAKTWYRSLPPEVRQYIEKQNPSRLVPSTEAWLAPVLAGTAAGISKIVDIILIPVLAFYFVLDGRSLRNEFLSILPTRRRKEAISLMRESSLIMRTFVVAQIWLCIIAGVVVFIGLTVIHMPSPLVLGLLAGVTRAIPIIGPIIAGIPIVLLAALQPHNGIEMALKVLAFFSIMHLVESKLIMPKFIGHRINLHAALVIIVLLMGYEFFGLLGMFMAAPVAAFARILVRYYVIRPRRRAALAAATETSTAKPSLIINAR